MNSENLALPKQLSDDQLLELEKLAALTYSTEEIAIYFNVDFELFTEEVNNPSSKINYHLRRGKLISNAKKYMSLLDSAEGGNVTAVQQLDKVLRDKSFEVSRDDIIFGPDTEAKFALIENYINTGCKTKLSNNEALYIEILTMINTLNRRFGKRKTIKFLTSHPFNYGQTSARNMFDESINMFYADRNLDRVAMRNLKAEQIENAAQVLLTHARTSKDFDVYKNMQLAAADLRGLNDNIPTPPPKELYNRPIKVYTLDPELIGIGAISRQDVASQIDNLNIPKSVKSRIRQDALITDVKFEEIIENVAQKED
jgi:hypothetical protein